MSTITCLKELEEKGKLEHSDIVEFTVKEQIKKYIVKHNFLQDKSFCDNAKIFKILEINKSEIVEKAYGYKENNDLGPGQWPYSENDDFPALTRLVAELYLIIEEREPVCTKFTRFEIMEI